jgi:F-type H+-transporting ATPase subunit gamma
VAVIAETLTEKFVNGEYDKIELIYNQFKTQLLKSQTEQFLPLAPIKSDVPVTAGDYIFETKRRDCIDFDS